MKATTPRRFVSPLGSLCAPTACTVTPADKPKWFILNRYPRQIIGFAIRLPDEETLGGRKVHHALSVRWATPAKWWP